MSIQFVTGTSTTTSGVAPLVTPRHSAPETQVLAESAVLTQQAPPAVKDTQASRQQLEEAVKSVNDFVSTVNNSIQFIVDDDTGRNLVKVVDKATKEVIRQIPSEEMLVISKALDSIKGLLVQQKV